MNTSDLVWHYTKHDVVEKIIANHELWAADIAGLNDATELKLGNKRVSQAFKALKRGWDHYDSASPEIDFKELKVSLEGAGGDLYHGSAFVTCFSPAPDDTEQWQKYALADGFAVGIPRGVYLPVVGTDSGAFSREPYIEEFPFRWLDLIYDKKAQLELATRAIWEIRDGEDEGAYVDARHDVGDNFGSIFLDRGSSGYVDAVASIKHRDFVREREVRYAVTRPENLAAIHPNPVGTHTHVRITGSNTEPLSTDWDFHDPEYYQELPSLLPIVSIRVGPRNDFATEKARLRPILDANGYNAVNIVKSKSPLR
jgi:hypothetical protein